MRVSLSVLIGAAIAVLVPANIVQAATATTSFQVTATVLKFCTVVATPMAFGNYTSSTVSETTSEITVTCTNGTPYDIGLSAGTAAGATVTTRQMSGTTVTAARLNYFLYSDTGRTVNWGNTVGTDTVHITAGATPIISTVYGRVPAGQFVAPDAYLDTIAVTVTY
ncbi:MAG TPA: spore coat U domain-containing protein [Inquilinus sp.]|uniref:Csu type fimbrial protein n=1 Tax=Inquilinus sp. TaxID=1932117 RepID=UPI002FAACD33